MKNILITLLSLGIILISLSSCSRNPSSYSPENPYSIQPPVQPPVPTPSPQPPTYSKPAERKLDFLISLDISKESASWLPTVKESLGKWLQALVDKGFNIKVGIINNSRDKDELYDFSIQNVLMTDKDILTGFNSILDNPANMKVGKGMQFLSLETSYWKEEKFFFRKDSDRLFYTFSNKPESENVETPNPKTISRKLYQALVTSGNLKSINLISLVNCVNGMDMSWIMAVQSLMPSSVTANYGCITGQKYLIEYPLKPIFGPEALPKL